MGQIGHNAHAVTGCAQGIAACAVSQALDNGESLVNRAMGGFSGQVDDRADPAAFMFQFLMIKGILSVHHDYSSGSADALRICAA